MRRRATEQLTIDDHRNWMWASLLARPRTERETREELSHRGLDGATADALIDEAVDAGLLDDAAYAELFAQGHEGWGAARIAWELRRRGVEDEDVRAALDEIDDVPRARAIASELRERGVEDRKIVARLQRRGFDARAIRSASREDR